MNNFETIEIPDSKVEGPEQTLEVEKKFLEQDEKEVYRLTQGLRSHVGVLLQRGFSMVAIIGVLSGALGKVKAEELVNQVGFVEPKIQVDDNTEAEQDSNLEEVREGRVAESVKHNFGNIYELKSRSLDGEFYPSGKNTIFERAESPVDTLVSGGFVEDPQILHRYAMFVETVDVEDVDSLLEEHPKQIQDDQGAQEALHEALQDKFVYIVAKQFLEDGGEFYFGRGRYVPDPLGISFGDNASAQEIQRTLIHELQHYAFDKQDAAISETEDPGGFDHNFIGAIDDRFDIIYTISHGEIPNSDNVQPMSNYTMNGGIEEQINDFLENNDISGLQQFVESDEFITTYVQTDMVTCLSINEHVKNSRYLIFELSNGTVLRLKEDYRAADEIDINIFDTQSGKYIDFTVNDLESLSIENLEQFVPDGELNGIIDSIELHKNDPDKGRESMISDEQMDDIAYLNAYNASILQQSIRLAAILSEKMDVSVEDVYKHEQYQEIFIAFIKELSDKQSADKKSPVNQSARQIMDNRLASLLR
jgi:hypothetical protein